MVDNGCKRTKKYNVYSKTGGHSNAVLLSKEVLRYVYCRCRLPSGKIVWLCKEHQAYQHVVKLSTGSTGGSYTLKKVLHKEDKLLMNLILESGIYKKLKNIKTVGKVGARI